MVIISGLTFELGGAVAYYREMAAACDPKLEILVYKN
jgi:hypothetical protein